MGWKLTKFHILLHLTSDIQRLSIPLNFDSNVVESHHKQEKKGGNRTQMRASKIDKQTATRRTEHMLINRAYNDLYPPGSLFDDDEDNSDSILTVPNRNDNSLSSLKMVFLPEQGLFFTNSRGHPSRKINQLPGSPYLLSQINDFLESFFSTTNLPVNGVGIYTRMQVEFANEDDETNLYRGDPFWTSNHTSSFKVVEEGENAHNDNPWHDFVYVKWRTTNNSSSTYETIIPARILFFFKIPNGCNGEDMDQIIYPPGPYALVQSCVEDLNAFPPTSQTAIKYYSDKYGKTSKLDSYLAHPSCSIIYWTMMELTSYRWGSVGNQPTSIRVPQLYVVSADNICGSCIAVPYDLCQNPIIEWMIVRNRDEWDENFLSDMSVRIQGDNQNG
jgi:hypothetical protein